LRHYGARVTDRFRIDSLRTVILENEFLRVTLLVDQGCDLIELLYKPADIDFLWRSPQWIRRRDHFVPTTHNTRPFFDYYEGGWQELFPHASTPSTYAGAELGFHGEVWGLPWDYEITVDEPERVEVRFQVRTVRMPFLLTRNVSLRKGEPILRFHESVVNEGERELEFMWGHHPAFGPPFLDADCILDAPAEKVMVGDDVYPWPVDPQGTDHSRLTPEHTDKEVMKYLHGLRAGWVALTQPKSRLGVGLVFDPQIFSYVWLWHEFGYTKDYPWFGRAYVLGMEPHSSLPGARETQGRLLRLAAGARMETDLLTVVYEAPGVRHIAPDGRVTPK